MVLPPLPTVPLLLLAAFCFARSSGRLRRRLVSHPAFGPPIGDWRRSGAIGRRTRWLATAAIFAACALFPALGVRLFLPGVQALALTGVAGFSRTGPDRQS